MTEGAHGGTSVLDPAQLVRIEAVHRGFLFQHLYAVQCLMSAAASSATSVTVESDEDIEIQFAGRRIYIQVKHRKEPLAWNDVEDALTRFGELRAAHEHGERHGEPTFLIVSNAAPNGRLAAKLKAADWPDDVQVDWPTANPETRILPTPQPSLLEAAEAARRVAEELPFATLSPETLVWKLAGLVSLAATGDDGSLNHTFQTEQLPRLFEQLVVQLQDLPLPPSPYRVQENEPNLWSGERVRLIVGYSGAGKTSWLAQSAQHASGALIYLDVADTPGAALANAVAREIAGRLFATAGGLGNILLPGSSGREILQALSRRLVERGEAVTVALDNVHQLGTDDLVGVVQAGRDIRFILLGRPEGDISTLETVIGVAREALLGWAPDTVAAAAHAEDCRGDAADCQRLIDLTGGLPLFVLNAISVAKSDYGGSLKRLCADLARSAHTREIAQDLILGRVFDRLPGAVADIAELLSLCDAPLRREEARSYVAATRGSDPAVYDRGLRQLLGHGLLQVFANDRIKLHDAARAVGKGRLLLSGSEVINARRVVLRAIVEKSLVEYWHPAMFSLFLRLTGEVGRLDVLVEMATEELFHEMGVWPEVEAYLEQGSRDEAVPPDQRIKALDGLAFADQKAGSDRVTSWLDQMDALIEAHDLGAEERLRVGMKRMTILAGKKDRRGAMRLLADLKPLVDRLPPSHRRVFRYNVACAELMWGDADAAVKRVEPLIKEYYDLIGLSPEMVMGNNAPELARMLKDGADVDDVKHLADSLDVLAKARDAKGQMSPFARIHALKFYDLARAPDSMFRVGQDLVDQYVRRRDFDGALDLIETILLPQLRQWKLADYLIPVRSQYAVVLAYCERYSDAEAEMKRLEPYEGSLAPLALKELNDQRDLIATLRAVGSPPKRVPAPGFLEGISDHFRRTRWVPGTPARPDKRKIGRNEQCPCGSGRKYKNCHDRED
ncbi:hypothetical protein B2G69_03750 [Methylorubrum zatmanii]|nr:SEC-C metal-binding domain-containing protein [Methylorubrum zatmanii]ARO53357.1 hypothetical protein B2G69_03750 [Methylorubrum zatmanii]